MPSIKIICVGKLKEAFYTSAAGEYLKRLAPYAKMSVEELPEVRLPESPSPGDIRTALEAEAERILPRIPKGACTVALCVEGRGFSSPALAAWLSRQMNSGFSQFCFLIGGSYGLSERVKAQAALRLSMSEMTFPHHLARVMLLEQIYRAFKINENARYHK